jgi:hypothetical protein
MGYSRQYAVFHLRGPYDNTFFPFEGAYDDRELYCTMSVLRRLLNRDVKAFAISNNATWANGLLKGHRFLRVLESSKPFDDMTLLLGASIVVQHAWGGWSSYSTVPALAAGIPLITTFRGSQHRLDLFHMQGSVPSELYTCGRKKRFLRVAFGALGSK